jgi:hypothetical protein
MLKTPSNEVLFTTISITYVRKLILIFQTQCRTKEITQDLECTVYKVIPR